MATKKPTAAQVAKQVKALSAAEVTLVALDKQYDLSPKQAEDLAHVIRSLHSMQGWLERASK
jgi:hypothetical protein